MVDKNERKVIEVDIHRETEKAWHVSFLGYGKERHWLPKSQAEIYENGFKEMMSLPLWIFEQKVNGDA